MNDKERLQNAMNARPVLGYVVRKQTGGYLTPNRFRDGANKLCALWSPVLNQATIYKRQSQAQKAADRWGGNAEMLYS